VHYVLGSRQGQSIKGDILGDIPAIIKKRINDLGYTSILRIIKDNRLDILVENVHDTFSLRHAILQNTTNQRIEFREVYTLDELPSLFPAADKASGKILVSAKREEESIYSIISPLAPDEIDGKNVFPPALGSVNKKDTVILNRILHQAEVLHALPADLQFYYGILSDENVIRNIPDDLYLYAIRTGDEKAIIQNEDIESAEMKYTSNDQPGILLKLNDRGGSKWAHLINKNTGRYIAMILDGIVTSAPMIHNASTGRWVMLNGRFTIDEAMILAQQLNEKLPANDLTIIKEEISSKSQSSRGSLVLILLLTFAVVAGLAFLLFNNLKNR
jgi:SecD/SecF fusion protein